MSQSVQSQLASDAVVKMLKQSFTCLLLLYVYILEGSARPENSPSQDTNRVKRSVIYDQNNDWDSIMLKGKDFLNEIKNVARKRWKGVVDHNENAKHVDNYIFNVRCKLNEVKDHVYNFGPIKYVREMYDEFMYYRDYFKEQYKNTNWNG